MSQPTYCLHKLQAVLADFLDIDKSTLPDVRDILKQNGYIGVQKGEEIEYFSKGLEEFGTNYPQYYHNGAGAITKLLETQEGQVAGAFYRQELGDIDLVWGEITNATKHDGYGLSHILDKRTAEFMQEGLSKEQAEIKAREFAQKEIPNIFDNGEVIKKPNEAVKIETDKYKLILKQNWEGEPTQNKWLVTAYFKKEKEPSISTGSFTKEENLSLNSSGDSTTTTPKTQPPLTPLQKALQEKQDKLQKEATELAKAQEAEQAKLNEYAQKIEDIDKQKQALAGLSANERALERTKPIAHTPIGVDSNLVLDNDKIIPLEYVKIKGSDVAPNFEANALQPRTAKQDTIIESIAKDFKAPLMIGVGGFRDLPIITQWGAVISGNHRLEGMLHFSPKSRKTYEQAIKKAYGIELAPDELILRMPKENLSDKDLVELAFASNLETTQNIGDKALGSLGKYATNLDNLPRYIESESVEDLAYQVARKLEKDNAYPDIESTNLALLSHLAKNSNGKSIADVLNTLDKDLPKELANKLKDMFIKNAGQLHNLVNNLGEAGLKSLELRPYLLDSISATAHMLSHDRAQNFSKLAHDIEHLLATTDKNGMSEMLALNPEIYKNTISDLLGASLARFVRLENPAGSLYDVLKNTKSDLEELVTPTFFKEGKSIEQADIYDFIENLIVKGEPSEATSKVIDLLPALREKHQSYKTHQRENFVIASQSKQSIPQDLQEAWIKEFNLKNIDDEFVPNFKPEVKEALARYGIDTIKLGKGSLIKLVRENRFKYLDRIKPTLQEPDRIIKQDDITFIFAKDFGEEKYFTSVAKDDNGEWVITSNAPKSENGLNNKIKNGGVEIYSKQAGSQINAPTPYDDVANSNIKLDTLDSTTNTPKSQDKQSKAQAKKQEVLQRIETKKVQEPITPEEQEYINNIFHPKQTNVRFPTTFLDPAPHKQDYFSLTHLSAKQQELLTPFVDKIKDNVAKLKNIEKEVDKLTQEFKQVSETLSSEQRETMRREYVYEKISPIAAQAPAIETDLVRTIRQFRAYQSICEFANTPNAILSKQNIERHVETLNHLLYQKYYETSIDKDFVDTLIQARAKTLQELLNDIPASQAPQTLSHAQIQNVIAKFDNIENLKHHIATRIDSKKREGLFHLLDTTIQAPQVQWIKEGKDKRLKKFQTNSQKEPYFYLLVTKDNDKTFITHLKTRDLGYLQKEIESADEILKGADIIGDFRQQAGSGISHKSPTSKTDSTTNTQTLQTKEIENANNGLYHAGYDSGDRHRSSGHNSLSENKVDDRYAERRSDERFTDREKHEAMGERGKTQGETGNKNADIEATKREVGTRDTETKTRATNLQDTIFKDTKGKEHTLSKETQEQWLKTFELENLEQSYIPKHSEAIKEALGGKEIRLQKGSLLKLVSQGREEFIPQIKAVLDEPDLIIKEPSEEILLAKHLKDKDYFVNVSFDNGEYLVSISNGIKETRNLQNKLNAGAKVIYQSPNANSISQTLLQTSQYSANKIDKANSTTNTPKVQTNPHLNQSLQEAQKIFKTYNKDEYNDKLFDKIIEVANKLDVRYWEQSNPVWVNGTYTYYLNRAMIDSKLLQNNPEKASQTLLHELIHSTTSRALHLYDNGHKELLSKAQQEAISEIKAIYNTISEHNRARQWKAYNNNKDEVANNKGRIYGLKNEHEMLAELANRDFRDFLKEQNLFTKIINAIAKVFSYIKGGSDDVATNALKEIESSLYKLIDNYEPNFSSEFDKVYAREGFIDLDNYKKYLSKHSAKVKEYKDDNIAVVNVKEERLRNGELVQVEEKARLWAQDIARGGITKQALRERAELFFTQYYDVPFQEIESNPIGKELIEQLSGRYFKGRALPHEDFLEYTNRLEKIKALKPLFTSGAYKDIDSAYAATLLDTINTILQKPNLLYKKRAINGFFAREFVESEVKKLTTTQESLRLESKFLNNKGKIDFWALESEAVELPKALKFSEFKEAFGVEANKNTTLVKTPIKDVEIDVRYAFLHLNKTGKLGNHKENRAFLSGAVLPTLENPLFITKDIKRDSYYFYKPFMDKNRIIHFVSVEVDKSSKLHYKTSYKANTSRLLRMIRNNELLYFSKDNAQPTISTKGGGDV